MALKKNSGFNPPPPPKKPLSDQRGYTPPPPPKPKPTPAPPKDKK